MKILSLRIPDDIYKELIKLAFEEDRSINGEIISIIKKYIEIKKGA